MHPITGFLLIVFASIVLFLYLNRPQMRLKKLFMEKVKALEKDIEQCLSMKEQGVKVEAWYLEDLGIRITNTFMYSKNFKVGNKLSNRLNKISEAYEKKLRTLD